MIRGAHRAALALALPTVLGAQGINQTAVAFDRATFDDQARFSLFAAQDQAMVPSTGAAGASLLRIDARTGTRKFAGFAWTATGTVVGSMARAGQSAYASDAGVQGAVSVGLGSVQISGGWRGVTGGAGAARTGIDYTVPVGGPDIYLTFGIEGFRTFARATQSDTTPGSSFIHTTTHFDTTLARWDTTRLQIDVPTSISTIRGSAPSQAVARVGAGWRMFGAYWRARLERELQSVSDASVLAAAPPDSRLSAALDVDRPITAGVAIAMSVSSRRPLDAGTGLFASIGLRWHPHAAAPGASAHRELDDEGVRFSWAETDGGTIRVRAPEATRVEIESDVTQWRPMQLARAGADGWWVAKLVLASGLHRVRMRIDGGEWVVPPGLPSEHGEFGAESGILVAP